MEVRRVPGGQGLKGHTNVKIVGIVGEIRPTSHKHGPGQWFTRTIVEPRAPQG